MQTDLTTRRVYRAAALFSALALCGCAQVAEQTTIALSSSTPAIAVLDGRVLWGQATFSTSREATVRLENTDAPAVACSGHLRFTATSNGVVGFSCSDGRSATLPFQSLSPLSGTGSSGGPGPAMAFTYGLAPDKAAGYLAQPVDRLKKPEKPAS